MLLQNLLSKYVEWKRNARCCCTAGFTIHLINMALSPLNRRPVRLYLLSGDPLVNTLHNATPVVVYPLNFISLLILEHAPFVRLARLSRINKLVQSDQSVCCDMQVMTWFTRLPDISRLILGYSCPRLNKEDTILESLSCPSGYLCTTMLNLESKSSSTDSFRHAICLYINLAHHYSA